VPLPRTGPRAGLPPEDAGAGVVVRRIRRAVAVIEATVARVVAPVAVAAVVGPVVAAVAVAAPATIAAPAAVAAPAPAAAAPPADGDRRGIVEPVVRTVLGSYRGGGPGQHTEGRDPEDHRQ